MVEKYREIVERLERIDAIRLFAIAKMDDLTDRWSLIVGVEDHPNFEDRKKMFTDIIHIVRDNLSAEDFSEIARGTLKMIDDHLVQDLLAQPVNAKIENVKANGNFVHEGYVLISRGGS